MSLPEPVAAVIPLQARRKPALALLVALRPRQWPKNLLLFAGIIFASEVGNAGKWLQAGTAFLVYLSLIHI